MTTESKERVKCAVCGKTSEHYVVMSTNTMGAPDLDLRPAEMKRSTMDLWVQECPSCGYCNSSLDDETSATKAYTASDEYRTVFSEVESKSLAARFLRQAKICEKDEKWDEFPFLYLSAAWDCDDRENEAGAKRCRQASLDAFEKYKDKMDGDAETFACMMVDMYRRTGQFDKAVKLAKAQTKTAEQEIIRDILTFEIAKCKAKDTACYTVNDALGR